MPFRWDARGSGYYGLMADALRHGHLALRIQPPQGLLDLPNPYDPHANAQFRAAGLHDLSLRNGHLYAYWGPTAAIVLFAPLQVLGIDVPQAFAVALFGFLGFLFSALALRFLVRRFLPATPRWALATATVALALGNSLPFILRRPAVYEVAITCGMCFGMLGLWLLVTGWYGPRPSRARLAGASLALGLALASRPTLGALAVVPLVLVVVAWRRTAWPGIAPRAVLTALVVPFAACALLVIAYNVARFGSPLEFGQKYQMMGSDPAGVGTFVPAYIPSGLYLYLFALPRPIALFPFLQLQDAPTPPWTVPEGFVHVEATGGAFVLVPLLVWIFLLPSVGRTVDPELRRIAGAFVAAGALAVLAMSFLLPGATQRYAVDFLAVLMIPALLVWFAALTGTGGRRRRAVVIVGLLLALWTSAAGIAIGLVGYDNPLERHHPKLFHGLQDTFSPLSALEMRVVGRPVIGSIAAPRSIVPGASSWGTLGEGDGAGFYVTPAPTTVTVVAPRGGTYHLRGLVGAGPGAPVATMVVRAPHGTSRTVAGTAARAFDLPVVLDAGVSRIVWDARASRASGPLLVRVQDLSLSGPDR